MNKSELKVNVLMRKNLSYQHSDLRIFVFEKFTSKLSIEQFFNINCFTILLVNTGSLTIRVAHTEHSLSSNELLVIPVRTSSEILQISGKLEISLFSFTSDFIFKNAIRKPNIGFFDFFITKLPSKVILKDNELLLLNDLFALMEDGKYKIKGYVFYNQVLLLSFNLLLYVLAAIYSRNSYDIKVKHTRKEKLVFQFLEILEINCTKQHSVKFYADALFISKGHLSKTVKQVTNKTIKQYIEEAIVLEAKILLQNDDLTILQIIEELQFCNFSSFSNFFKKHTSMSPSEYRLKLKFE